MPIPVKKISAYNPKDAIVDNDIMLVTAKGETYNATAKVFMEYVKNHPEMDALFATDAQLESVRKTLASTISAETSRAKKAESTLTSNLNTEISRAKKAESTLTSNLNTEISRAKKAESDIQNVIDSNKNNWNDKYTKNEIDNKFSTLENNIDWKESVATFADIAKTYPTPQDGWTVNVKDTDYTYRYSGSKWVIISANAIPNATQSVDGLLTASDKTNYDDANSKKHTHSNKSVLDGITSALVTAWNKVTDKVDNSADGADSLLSKITTTWTTIPTDDTYFIRKDTDGTNIFGRVKFSTLWCYIKKKTESIYAKVSHKHTKSQITDFPPSMPASEVYSWAKASTKPTYTKAEVGLGNVDNTADSAKSVKYATSAGSATTATTATNATKVNGHTVNSDVPSGAKFTDTVYTHPTGDGNKHIPANGTTNNGKYLKATGTAGSYQWGNITKNDVINALGYTPGTSSAEPIVYTTGTAEKEGLTKLYTGTGTATDGTMTQAAIKTALNSKAASSHTHNYAGSSSVGGAANSAIYSNKIANRGNHTEAASGTTANAPTTGMLETSGLYMTQTYNDSNTPVNYGNIINIAGNGTGQLLCEWSGSDNTLGHLYYRSHRDTNTGGWSGWGKIAFTTDNVASAVKLNSSAGSATQPVYFSGGKPVACSYTLGKSVPSNAVFTDTNTWRGIQDNLTSTSTTESLSAKQGKNLKTSVDNKIIKNSSSTAPTTQDNGSIWLKEYT